MRAQQRQERARTAQFVGTGAAVMALVLTGCGGGSAAGGGGSVDTQAIAAAAAEADPTAPETPTVRGAVWQGPISAQWFLGAPTAQEYGVTLESEWMTDATVGRTQLAAGDIDIVPGSTIGAVQLTQRGVDALIVGGNYVSQPDQTMVYAMPDSGITDVGDLAGKKIGMTALSGSHPNRIRLEIEKAGGDPDSLEIVAVPYSDMAAQLQSGAVDAVAAATFALQTVKGVGAQPVFDVGGGPYEGRPENVWITTREFYEQNPNTVAAFQCAMAAGGAEANDRSKLEGYLKDTLEWKDELIANAPKQVFSDGALDTAQLQADWDDDVAANGDPAFDVSTLVIPQPENC